MAYQADISRSNPGCFLFLLDQSGSMADGFSGGAGHSKADELATIINRLLASLVIRCSKDEGVRDYFDVGVIGYGSSVKHALSIASDGSPIVPISRLANEPLRVEDRVQKFARRRRWTGRADRQIPDLGRPARQWRHADDRGPRAGPPGAEWLGPAAPLGIPAGRLQHHRR